MPASGGRLLSVTEATHEGHVWVLPGLGGVLSKQQPASPSRARRDGPMATATERASRTRHRGLTPQQAGHDTRCRHS